MNLSDNFKKFMGMVEENAQQLKKDLAPTPLPSGPEVWKEGEKRGKDMQEDILKNRGLEKTLKERLGARLAKYSEDAAVMEPSGDWLGKQDAARHMLAVGDIARKTHPLVAKALAGAYELLSGSDNPEDAQMDEHNNALALELFNAKDYEEVKRRVKQLMEKAQYQDFTDKDYPAFLKLDQTELNTNKSGE